MPIFEMPNGDIELGDFAARRSLDWTNVVWMITTQCNLGCPYCIGAKSTGPAKSLVDSLGVQGTIDRFVAWREHNGKQLYITLTGGEPTLMPVLPEMCVGLANEGFKLELQTNLTTKGADDFIDQVPADAVAQIMATYHGWKLDTNHALRAKYMGRFARAFDKGMTPVLKTIIMPGEVDRWPEREAWLQSQLPAGGVVLPWIYIKSQARSKYEHCGAYPYAYTDEEHAMLDEYVKVRAGSQRAYRTGGGWHHGMQCDGGRGFCYLDYYGKVWRCFPAANVPNHKTLGDFVGQTVVTHADTVRCPTSYCSACFWAQWFGADPWNYGVNQCETEAFFSRHGPAVDIEQARRNDMTEIGK